MNFLVLACVTWTAVIMGLVWICLVLVERASDSCDANQKTERHGLFTAEDDPVVVQRVEDFEPNLDGAVTLVVCDGDTKFGSGAEHTSPPLVDLIIPDIEDHDDAEQLRSPGDRRALSGGFFRQAALHSLEIDARL